MINIVLVGAGHCNLQVLSSISTLLDHSQHRLVLISPDRYSYYSGMLPGYLAGQYHLSQLRIDVYQLCIHHQCHFIQAECLQVDSLHKTLLLQMSNGSTIHIHYHVVSFNIGSINKQIAQQHKQVIQVRPIAQFINRVEHSIPQTMAQYNRIDLVIVGGGAAGIELAMAMNQRMINHGYHNYSVSLINSRETIGLDGHPSSNILPNVLQHKHIRVYNQHRLIDYQSGEAILEHKCIHIPIPCNLVIVCSGPSSYDIFRHSHLAHNNGYMVVNPYLQSTSSSSIYGAGDCIHFQSTPLPKAGVYSVRQAPTIIHNILVHLYINTTLQIYTPQNKYLAIINTCDGHAICYYHCFRILLNRKNWANMKLKDYIDKRFMAQFKVKNTTEQQERWEEKNRQFVQECLQ